MARANLLDHLVGVGEQWRRNFDAERFFGLPAILCPAIESVGLRSNLSQRLLGSVAEFGIPLSTLAREERTHHATQYLDNGNGYSGFLGN
jgi:hypothetical protein